MYRRSIGSVSDNLNFEMNVKVQVNDFNQIDKIVGTGKSVCSYLVVVRLFDEIEQHIFKS